MRRGNYGQHFSNSEFGAWVRRFAKKAGRGVLNSAMELYLVVQSDLTPAWAKVMAVSALGYLILPVDLVLDYVFPVGLIDDASFMAATLVAVGRYVTPEISEEARRRVDHLIGSLAGEPTTADAE